LCEGRSVGDAIDILLLFEVLLEGIETVDKECCEIFCGSLMGSIGIEAEVVVIVVVGTTNCVDCREENGTDVVTVEVCL
jgi:hypothetical protein